MYYDEKEYEDGGQGLRRSIVHDVEELEGPVAPKDP
jgi:hypothetical protein